MKTITVKLITKDSDVEALNHDIGRLLEGDGSEVVFSWRTRKSNKEELEWYEEQRDERKG